MQLLLDTNVLLQESLSSRNMQILLRLRRAGFVSIYIPSLVRREYLGNITQDAKDKVKEAVKRLESIARRHGAETETGRHLYRVLPDINRLVEAIDSDLERHFDAWLESEQVQIVDYDPARTGTVLDNYFSGSAPFRSARSKADLLDAMIMTCIEELSSSETIIVAVHDRVFRTSLAQIRNVHPVENISEFLALPEVAAEITRLDEIGTVEAFKEALEDSQFQAVLKRHIVTSQSVLDDIYVQDAISGADLLQIEVFGLRVNPPESTDVRDFSLGQVDYLGQGRYAVSFCLQAQIQIDYCASYRDYLELSHEREREVSVDSMNRIGICDLSEVRPVQVRGQVFIDVGPVTSEALGDVADGGRLPARLKVHLDAESAAILPNQWPVSVS